MRVVAGREGVEMPVLGQGTWMMGDSSHRRPDEVAALRQGLDLGLSLIDTAEMYADGGAEEVVAEAIAGRREEVFLVSKVLPHNASFEGTLQACEQSLSRLGTDRLDLYLLHWPGRHALEDTYRAFQRLVEQGKILHYGVSNFDLDDMDRSDELRAGERIVCNQVLYNLSRRGIERALLPRCVEAQIVVMAYTPLESVIFKHGKALNDIAARHERTPHQIALAWVLSQPGVMTIPKASDLQHVRQNAEALEIELTHEDLAELDAAFPVPERDIPLETL